jgi:hypothetical protein
MVEVYYEILMKFCMRPVWFLQFHQRYNPNLIDDHCQEMSDQLKRRHLKARRITSMVAQGRRMTMGVVPSSPVPEEFARPRRMIETG